MPVLACGQALSPQSAQPARRGQRPELPRLLLDYNAPLNTRQTALDLTPLDLARLSQRPAMAAELEAEDAESGTAATASRR